MREIERSAPSVDAAIEAALAEAGLRREDAEIEVVQEPRGGFLGVGRNEAIVRVKPRSPDMDATAQGELAADFVEGLLDRMDLDGSIQPRLVEGTMYVDVTEAGEDGGLLIGKQGQTLEALQEITRAVIQRQSGSRSQVIVDVEGYRKRQRSQLEDRARRAVEEAIADQVEIAMDPMTPYERKIVHGVVAASGRAESHSEGDEPDRYVIIRPLG